MKKFLLIFCMISLLLMAGCGVPEEPVTEQEPQPETILPEVEPTPLTPEELAWFTEYTATFGEDGEHSYLKPISCFFTSQYETVTELDFQAFMRYFPTEVSGPDPVSDAEFEALKQVEAWPFKDLESKSDMPVPIHKYLGEEVNAVLTEYAGITADQLDTSQVAYLEEYDAYYNYTSDFGAGMFTPISGEKDGDTVTLQGEPLKEDGSPSVLVLKQDGERWLIVSFHGAR